MDATTSNSSPVTGNSSGADKAGRCHACGCVGPNPGSDPLSLDEVHAEFATLKSSSLWALAEDGKSITRTFTCRNWQAAMDVLNAVGAIAERADIQHHPDLHLTRYRDVEIRIYTHAAGGLTNFDFLLARAIDEVKVDFSPKWLREHPAAADCQLVKAPTEKSTA